MIKKEKDPDDYLIMEIKNLRKYVDHYRLPSIKVQDIDQLLKGQRSLLELNSAFISLQYKCNGESAYIDTQIQHILSLIKIRIRESGGLSIQSKPQSHTFEQDQISHSSRSLNSFLPLQIYKKDEDDEINSDDEDLNER